MQSFRSCAVAQTYHRGAKPLSYTISDLNVTKSSETQSVAYSLNNNVQVAGNIFASGDQQLGFLRDSYGAMTMVPVGMAGAKASARAVSSLGEVTGYSSGFGVPTRAFRWTTTTGTAMLNLGESSAAFGINIVGDVVGTYHSSGNDRAFIWDRFGSTIDLGVLDDSPVSNATAYAVNDSKLVVGVATTGDGYNHAFVWSPGQGLRSLFPGVRESGALAISNYGRITGFVQNKHDAWQAFIYDTKTGITALYGPPLSGVRNQRDGRSSRTVRQ